MHPLADKDDRGKSDRRNQPQVRNDWNGGDFGVYMQEKNRKLQIQGEAQFRNSGEGETSDLMKGVVIHVSGITNPSREEIRKLIIQHGGRYETYFDPSIVTHFMVSNVSFARYKQLAKQNTHVNVVTPDWLVRSIDAKLRLPVVYFVPNSIREQSQKRLDLSAFQTGRKFSDGTHTTAVENLEGESVKDPTTDLGETMIGEQQVQDADTKDQDAVIEVVDDAEFETMDHGTGVCGPMKEKSKEVDLPRPRQLKNTSENPDFVKQFFAQSRLHFIGSFRARYEHMMSEVARRLGMGSSLDLLSKAKDSSLPRIRTIVHIDMDCFFASAAMAENPGLRDKPVAVCHSTISPSNLDSRGEISSANYAARLFGVKAGMFLSTAKRLCPDLISVPYNFDLYEQLAIKVITVLFKYAQVVQVKSVDEAYIDLSDQEMWPVRDIISSEQDTSRPSAGVRRKKNPCQNIELFVSELRREIFETTQCTASAGIGPNMLVARLATAKAKPNGQCRIHQDQVLEFMKNVALDKIPGVGWRTLKKLHSDFHLKTVDDVLALPRSDLDSWLYDTVRGICYQQVQPLPPRKSLSVSIGWGVRFGLGDDEAKKALHFVESLAEEICDRLAEAKAISSRITVEFMKRRKGAPEPMKPLGHGLCDLVRFSATLSGNDHDTQRREIHSLSTKFFHKSQIPMLNLRGVSIHAFDLRYPGSFGQYANAGGPKGKSILDYFRETAKTKKRPLSDLSVSKLPDSGKQNRVDINEDGLPDPRKSNKRAFLSSQSPPSSPAEKRAKIEDNVRSFEKASWDPEVFDALPSDIRKELMERCNVRQGPVAEPLVGASGDRERTAAINSNAHVDPAKPKPPSRGTKSKREGTKDEPRMNQVFVLGGKVEATTGSSHTITDLFRIQKARQHGITVGGGRQVLVDSSELAHMDNRQVLDLLEETEANSALSWSQPMYISVPVRKPETRKPNLRKDNKVRFQGAAGTMVSRDHRMKNTSEPESNTNNDHGFSFDENAVDVVIPFLDWFESSNDADDQILGLASMTSYLMDAVTSRKFSLVTKVLLLVREFAVKRPEPELRIWFNDCVNKMNAKVFAMHSFQLGLRPL